MNVRDGNANAGSSPGPGETEPSRAGLPRLSARARLAGIADAGTFRELDFGRVAPDPLRFPGYAEKLRKAREASGESESAVAGECEILGVRSCVFAAEPRFMMGSFGVESGERITRLFERATDLGLPVAGFALSGGARMQEGALSLMQMAKTSAAIRRHSDSGLAYVSIVLDPTYGGALASFASLGDILASEPGASIGFAGDRVRLGSEPGVRTAESAFASGFLDGIVDRPSLKGYVGGILRLLTRERVPFQPSSPDPTFASVEPRRRYSASESIRFSRSDASLSCSDFVSGVIDGFVELHGDRRSGDDPAVIAGLGRLCGRPVAFCGTERGKDLRARIERSFGMPGPGGFAKALRIMRIAGKFGLPILCFVDTPGARADASAERGGVGQAIARTLSELSALRAPIISVIAGAACSGGALAFACGDLAYMAERAFFSVISPESCARILRRPDLSADFVADSLRLTASDLLSLGVVDGILPDCPASPPSDRAEYFSRMKNFLASRFSALESLGVSALLARRGAKYRKF